MKNTEKDFGDKLLEIKQDLEDYFDTLYELEEKDFESLKNNKDTSKKSSVVVGHSKKSPGAYGVDPINEYEYAWNKKLANKIKDLSISGNIDCEIFYRDDIGIEGAYEKVKAWGSGCNVEIHFNAFDKQVRGTETLFGTEQGVTTKSKEFAEIIQGKLTTLFKRSGSTDRGIKGRKIGERGGKSVNAVKDIPNCLLEPFFGDNTEDAKLGHENIDEYAKAIVEAFKEILL